MNNLASKAVLSLSAAGLILLAGHEGFSSKPYLDTGGIWTNGFGNTQISPEKPVDVVKALADLGENTKTAQRQVSACVKAPINQNQFDAFVSFAYNVGGKAFCNSTMLKKFNQGDATGSCKEFDKWVYVAGKDCRIAANNCMGIVKRRSAEKKLCMGELS